MAIPLPVTSVDSSHGAGNTTINVTWVKDEGGDAPTGFNIYMDGNYADTAGGGDSSKEINAVPEGDHVFSVGAYNVEGEADAVNGPTITVDTTAPSLVSITALSDGHTIEVVFADATGLVNTPGVATGFTIKIDSVAATIVDGNIDNSVPGFPTITMVVTETIYPHNIVTLDYAGTSLTDTASSDPNVLAEFSDEVVDNQSDAIGSFGDENAANIILGACTVYLDGVDIGFTKGGVTIRCQREYTDVQADQAVGTIRKGRKNEKLIISTSLLEITMERLRVVWDQPTDNYATDYLYLGYGDSCNVGTHTLKLVGVAPNCGTRVFFAYKVISVGEAPYKMSRDEESSLAVEFECLKDSSNDNKFGWALDY